MMSCRHTVAADGLEEAATIQVFHEGDWALHDVILTVAEELTNALAQGIGPQHQDGNAMASCPLARSNSLQKLHLYMLAKGAPDILAKLAMFLKSELLHTGFRTDFIEGPQKPVTLQIHPGAPKQIIMEDCFCIGRLPTGEVQVDIHGDPASKIYVCVFNLPGSVIVVDGWNCSGLRVEVAGRKIPKRVTGSVFMIPHDTSFRLHVGKHCLLIGPPEGRELASQELQQE
mmetsp:Transcript_126196/g.252080  ORF Transcript_126196/g.252080 Transcript_126196/m.252080 type:complete len:229 (-) Transcript_126196:89-775(-)